MTDLYVSVLKANSRFIYQRHFSLHLRLRSACIQPLIHLDSSSWPEAETHCDGELIVLMYRLWYYCMCWVKTLS